MIPIDFPGANAVATAPEGMTQDQVAPIPIFKGEIKGGPLDSMPIIICAWKPSETDIELLRKGGAVYLSVIGAGLPPHILSCTINEAIIQ